MNRRWRIVAFCLPLGILCLSGCLLPYAYPNLDCILGCDLDLKMPDCRVFRVDVRAHQADLQEDGEYTVVEIPRRSDGSFPPQFGLSVNRGVYVVGVALNYNIGCLHSTRVRIYRPGYQAIELEPWDSTEKVQWYPTTNWIEQEKAIDALLKLPVVGIPPVIVNHTPPCDAGYISTKATDLFAAAEYERVASLAPTPEDAVRLRQQAEQLRKLPKVIPKEEITRTGSVTTQPIPKSP
ncbi:MAG TPA: hypothetical protein VG122_13435 [Gemmata sp.]|jgi:hypothetical protein|nr:hypothetical protein [Gemmata sp.]